MNFICFILALPESRKELTQLKRENNSVFPFKNNGIIAVACKYPFFAGWAYNLDQPPSLGRFLPDNIFTLLNCFSITTFLIPVKWNFHKIIFIFSHIRSSFSFDICTYYSAGYHKDTIGIYKGHIKIIYRFRNDSYYRSQRGL